MVKARTTERVNAKANTGGSQRPASRKHQLRARRYETWRELKRATLDECRKRADASALEVGGERFTERQWMELRYELDGKTLADDCANSVDEGARIFAELYEPMQAAIAFARGRGANLRDYRAGLMRSLEADLGREFDLLRLAIENSRRLGLPTMLEPRVRPELARRQVLVMTFDKAGYWWWLDRKPDRTELAILSILAGNFPDRRRAFERGEFDPTVTTVIAAEACAIDLVRRLLRPPRDRAERAG